MVSSSLAAAAHAASAANAAISAANAASAAIRAIPAIPSVPGLQHGGPAKAFTAYVVGETGPELFIPRVDGDVLPHGLTESVLEHSRDRAGRNVAGTTGPVVSGPGDGDRHMTITLLVEQDEQNFAKVVDARVEEHNRREGERADLRVRSGLY